MGHTSRGRHVGGGVRGALPDVVSPAQAPLVTWEPP